MKFLVDVTKEHIVEGQKSFNDKNRCKYCPIAKAMSDVPGVSDVSIGLANLRFKYNDKVYDLRMPEIVLEHRRAFDATPNGHLLEFTFELELP